MINFKRAKYIRYCISILLILFGVVGLYKGFNFSSKELGCSKALTEMPLSNPEGIIVNNEGMIYCGLSTYGSVQVYDSNGNFQYRILINSAGGDFRLKVDNNDNLIVATIRNKALYVFDKEGNLVNQEKNENGYNDFGEGNFSNCIDNQGNKYFINNRFLYPNISKLAPNGEKTVVINTKISQWIFMQPFPAFLFVVLGLLLFIAEFNKVWEKIVKEMRKE